MTSIKDSNYTMSQTCISIPALYDSK